MDIFIATENIKNFKKLILVEKDCSQRRTLEALLRREEEKLAAAGRAEAQSRPQRGDPSGR
jgi:hypothetical protein